VSENNATSQHIYRCALCLLEAEGSQAVSMRRVAKDVGITAISIYHYFPSREALLNFIVDSEFEQLVVFFGSSSGKQSCGKAMMHSMDEYIDYALAHPRIFDYVFASPRPGARRYPEDSRAGRSPTLSLIAEIVSTRMKAGHLKCDDKWEMSMGLWAHAHGYLVL
jgi:AcrR family transcriptional regulator